MIDVAFYVRDGRLEGFNASGHALTAPKGQDIVCAGVSALLQSASGYAALRGIPSFRISGRRYMMRLKRSATIEQRRTASDILGMAFTGIASIAQSYPGSIRLTLATRRHMHV